MLLVPILTLAMKKTIIAMTTNGTTHRTINKRIIFKSDFEKAPTKAMLKLAIRDDNIAIEILEPVRKNVESSESLMIQILE